MPQIPGYEEHILAQGGINTRANPDDFGAQIGQGMQRFGAGLVDAGEAVMQIEERNQTANAQIQIAKERAAQTEDLFRRRDAADPNSPEIMTGFTKDIETSLEKGAGQFTTPQASKTYRTMAASLSTEMTQRALSVQSELYAEAARNQFSTLKRDLGNVVGTDPAQVMSVLTQAETTINTPGSHFSHIPATERAKYLKDLQNSIAFAAGSKATRVDPAATLTSFSPSSLAMFKPFEGLLEAGKVPGGQVNLKPETKNALPAIEGAAATYAVSPNIVAAVVQTPGGEGSKEPSQVAKTVSSLADKYGGDYSKAVAAYYFGAKPLDATVQRLGDAWQEALPAEVQQQVSTVMSDAGMVPVEAAPTEPMPAVPATPQTPAQSSLPWMQHLTWEQQDHLVKEAIQLQHSRLSMAHMARQEAEYQQKKVREEARGEYINKIIAPKEFGQFRDTDVVNDSRLTGEDRQHLAEYYRSRVRELRSDSENRTNPGEFRRLELQIRNGEVFDTSNALASYARGGISSPELQRLEMIAGQLKDSSTNNFQKQWGRAMSTAHDSFMKEFEAQLPGMMPKYASAFYEFQRDAETQMTELRKAGKDPRTLLDPLSREYILKPERMAAFLKREAPSKQLIEAVEKSFPPTQVRDGKTYYLWPEQGKYFLKPPPR
jgi:hypothetical protein